MDFHLSQKDLELRGSGDIFGVKQSGIPDFKIADLIRYFDILVQTRKMRSFVPRKIQQEKKPRRNAWEGIYRTNNEEING